MHAHTRTIQTQYTQGSKQIAGYYMQFPSFLVLLLELRDMLQEMSHENDEGKKGIFFLKLRNAAQALQMKSSEVAGKNKQKNKNGHCIILLKESRQGQEVHLFLSV